MSYEDYLEYKEFKEELEQLNDRIALLKLIIKGYELMMEVERDGKPKDV